MTKTIRSLPIAIAAALSLSACALLNAFIPDQFIADGVLGIGATGIAIPLAADVGATGVGAAQVGGATVFSGTVGVDAVDIEPVDDLPPYVEAARITETLALGDTIVVTYPTSVPVDALTLTALSLTGSVTISGTEHAFPVSTEAGLSVVFDEPTCDDGACAYTTANVLPEFEVAFARAAVAAYGSLLRDGGSIAAELSATATLAAPGLAEDVLVIVSIRSLGAVIEF